MKAIIVYSDRVVADCGNALARKVRCFRAVEDLSEVLDGEEVYSGPLVWRDRDPDGRWNAGWAVPSETVPIIVDYKHEIEVGKLREEIRRAQDAVKVAEEGRSELFWDNTAQCWSIRHKPPTDKEVQEGLNAKKRLPELMRRLKSMLSMEVDSNVT